MTLEAYLLGSPRFTLDGQRLNLSRRKSIALLSYLMVTRQPQSREALAALLWPDYDDSAARMNLRRDLSRLRKQLPDDALLADRLQVEFNPDTAVTIDLQQFETYLANAQSHAHPQDTLCPDCAQLLMNAVDLAESEFMAGFSVPDSDAFDEWLFFQREHWRRETAVACERLVQWCQDQEQFEDGIVYGRRWLALDSLHEPAHRALMQLYAQADQQSAALRQYDECVRLLDEELGIEPEAETSALAEAIRKRQFPPPAAKPAAPATPTLPIATAAPQTVLNLPPQTTTFVGRQTELADIQRLLDDPDCRLLLLLGPGGMGKTRLGMQTAVQMHTEFLHGACFISLAAITQTEFLPTAVAEALQLPFTGSDSPTEQILTFLASRQMLLVFDNLEQLLDARDIISQIIHTAPDVKILATSRERLHLQEEWVYDVPGLETPTEANLAEATSFSAVQLFVQRARQAQATFRLDTEEIPAVSAICRLVDGMPLGIELAAGWVSALSCAEIADELAQNLDLLTTPLHNIPERHRNLRQVFQHSWELLAPAQQTNFARLSVFRSGFTREAARVVAQASLTDLSQLVSKSLLRRTQNGRYDVHELLRQYAQEKLDETPDEGEAVRDALSRYYSHWLQTITPDLPTSRQRDVLRQIELDLENTRAGWHWLLTQPTENPDWPTFLDAYIVPLFHFYDTRSRFQEGGTAFREMAERLAQSDKYPLLLGKVLGRQGWFTFHLGRQIEAVSLLQRSLVLLQTAVSDADAESIFSYNYLGAVYRHLGQYDAAREQLETGLAICREVGDRFGATVALNILGQIAYQQGEYGRARELCQESLAIKRELGDQWGMTFSLTYLGTVARALGDQAEAEQLFSESLAISEEIGDQRGAATSHSHLGDLALVRMDTAAAQQHFQQSYRIFEAINNRLGSLALLTRLGDLALAQADLDAAWGWLAQALQLAQRGQITPQVLDLLTSVAAWQLAQDEMEAAAELLVPALNHPVSSEENRRRATALWQGLAGERPLPEPTADLDEQVALLIGQYLDEAN